MKREGEEGYALVAAVASIAVFAAMALTVLSATRVVLEDVDAEQAQLQAGAAADAGVAIAIGKLLPGNSDQRWSIDGQIRRLQYGDARMRIKVEDERGKVPINQLDEKLATRLLEEVGLGGERLLIARDSLLDWTDSDNETRPFGAEASYYRAAGILPPNGFLGSLEELRGIRGFDAETVERLRPFTTTYIPLSSFDPKFANPQALRIMEDTGQRIGGASSIDRLREWGGQRTAIQFADTSGFTGRPLTISVEAELPDGARAVRRAVVELTGIPERPFLIRAAD